MKWVQLLRLKEQCGWEKDGTCDFCVTKGNAIKNPINKNMSRKIKENREQKNLARGNDTRNEPKTNNNLHKCN